MRELIHLTEFRYHLAGNINSNEISHHLTKISQLSTQTNFDVISMFEMNPVSRRWSFEMVGGKIMLILAIFCLGHRTLARGRGRNSLWKEEEAVEEPVKADAENSRTGRRK